MTAPLVAFLMIQAMAPVVRQFPWPAADKFPWKVPNVP